MFSSQQLFSSFIVGGFQPMLNTFKNDPDNRPTHVGKPHPVVYLVDDDSRMRQSMSEMLATYAITVVSFVSAQPFLQHLRADTVACLVLDASLLDTNALDLQEHLKRQAAPPIIAISNHNDIPCTVRTIKAGAVEFLTKPLDPGALMSAVELAFAEDQRSRERHARMATLHQHFCRLTPREREVFALVVSGLRNKQAAWALGISEITLQIHRTNIMRKMAAASFADLVRMAATLEISISESNIGPMKQLGGRKNVVRSYDCSLAVSGGPELFAT
jgi:FixJ family two-component response regulator